jgi:hypothetical protein
MSRTLRARCLAHLLGLHRHLGLARGGRLGLALVAKLLLNAILFLERRVAQRGLARGEGVGDPVLSPAAR